MANSSTPQRDAVLIKYLNEAYGKERQLETALKAQIAIVDRPTLKKGLRDHLKVTTAQARGLKARIKALGGTAETGPALPGPDLLADAAGAAASVANKAVAAAKGPMQALRGTSEADNDLRNVRDCYWNEAEEIAHYQVIEAVAEELGDKETAKLARQYRKEEERMQALLAREIPKLIKVVIREEVPRDQRAGTRTTRSAASRSRSAASRSTSNGGSSRSSSRKPAAAASSRASSSTRKATSTTRKATSTARKATGTARKATGTTTRRATSSRSSS